MPAAAAPLSGFLLGVVFAWFAADALGRDRSGAGRALVVVSLFGLLVHAPITAYLLALAPDWSYAYFVDSQRLPGAVDPSLVLFDAASCPIGFAIATTQTRASSPQALLRLALVPAVLLVIALGVGLPRLAVHASYAQYHGDFGTRPVAGSALGYALLWMALVLIGAVAWTLHWLKQTGRAARRD